MNRIGTINEGDLHHALKMLYAEDNVALEATVGEYVVDILTNDGIIEIQTRGFSKIKQKIANLTQNHHVTLVYPIPRRLTLVKVDSNGEITRRKSPKESGLPEIFGELVAMPQQLQNPNLTLEVVYIHEEETRVPRTSKRRWRRRDFQRQGRRLVEVLERQRFFRMDDLFDQYSSGLPTPFSSKDLAHTLERNVRVGRQAAYCFRIAGVTHVVGKEGNSLLYSRSEKT